MDSKTETVSDNELIARFMGFEVYNDELFGKTIRVFSIKTNDSVLRALKRQHISQLQYNISWDWLMPVVEKIETLVPTKFSITTGYVEISPLGPYNQKIFTNCSHEGSKIKACYKAVVELISWYNNSQSPDTILNPTHEQ